MEVLAIQYIKLKSDGINSLVTNDYKLEINQYDIIDNIIFIMGSYMARGIIASSYQQTSSQYVSKTPYFYPPLKHF